MPNQHKYKLMRPHSKLVDQLPGEYPQSVNVALSRYLHVIADPPKFTEAEWNLLRDACNGWMTQAEPNELLREGLVLQVDDAMRLNGLAHKWNVDSLLLRQKLEKLTDLEAIAIIHAIELFWTRSDR